MQGESIDPDNIPKSLGSAVYTLMDSEVKKVKSTLLEDATRERNNLQNTYVIENDVILECRSEVDVTWVLPEELEVRFFIFCSLFPSMYSMSDSNIILVYTYTVRN